MKDLEAGAAKQLNIACYISSRRCGPNVLRAYYVAAIRSVLEYGSVALICATQTSLKKIEGLQNRAMRTITRVPIWTNKSTLHMELNLPPLHVRRKQLLLTASDKFLWEDIHPANHRLCNILDPPVVDQDERSWTHLTVSAWQAAGLTVPETVVKYRPANLESSTTLYIVY